MSVLKIGLIGCGRIAQLVHLQVLTHLPEAKLVALAEADPQRREEAHRYAPSAMACADYQELLALPEVEAVVICLPPALHAEAAIAAFAAQKHVYLEKPMATCLADAHATMAAWRKAGTVGMMGFNFRFHPLYQSARQYVQAGTLGELIAASSVFAVAARPLPVWKQARHHGGGVLLDLASHHVDLVHYLFAQEVVSVFAGLRSQRCEGDSATLHLRLSSGLLVQSFFSMSAVEDHRFEIYGQAGKLLLDRFLSLVAEITEPSLRLARLKRLWRGLRALHPRLLLRSPGDEPSFALALGAFSAAARTNCPIQPDLLDGYRSLAVIEAAEASVRTGRAVSPADVGGLEPADGALRGKECDVGSAL
jgi:predicted dehydrogenase